MNELIINYQTSLFQNHSKKIAPSLNPYQPLVELRSYEFCGALDLPINLQASSRFGSSIESYDNTLLISAPRAQFEGIDTGLVYSYTRNQEGDWVLDDHLPLPNDLELISYFGTAITANNHHLFVSTLGLDNLIYYYQKNLQDGDDAWELIGSLPEPTDNDGASLLSGFSLFGSALELIDESTLLVGASANVELDNLNQSGDIFIYHRNANNQWEYVSRFNKPQFEDLSLQNFGSEIASDGNRLFVSSFLDEFLSPEKPVVIDSTAEVLIYQKQDDDWVYQGLLTYPDNEEEENLSFGQGLDFDGVRLMIGSFASNQVYQYYYHHLDEIWYHHETINLNQGENQPSISFGNAVKSDQGNLFIGAPNFDDQNSNDGRVYYYRIEECE